MEIIALTDADRSLDIFGIKPVGEVALVIAMGGVEAASAFLSRICLPAAEEMGLLLRDKVSAWRANNATKIANKAEMLLVKRVGSERVHAHPYLLNRTIEHGSWQDDDEIQSMWAGLLASSCDATGENQHNIIYTRLLEQITSKEARFVSYVCENCDKYRGQTGLSMSRTYRVPVQQVLTIYGNPDIHEVDVELDHLREIGLIASGFEPEGHYAEVAPTPLALNFYIRCQGYVGSVADYFDLPAFSSSTDIDIGLI